MHGVGMKEALNDNDELPFVSIGLASMLILNKLRLATQLKANEEQHEEEHDDRTRSAEAQQDRRSDECEIDQGLKKRTTRSGQVG